MVGPNDWVVAELWRYPVKSMQGERLPAVKVQGDGLDGDRRWGVRDERTGRVLTGRREARLLEATASLGEGVEPVIKLPDGTGLVGAGDATDSALSDWLGRPVRLVEAAAHGDRAEYFADPTRRRERGDRVDDATRAVRRRHAAVADDHCQPARRRCAPPSRRVGRAPVPTERAARRVW
jgi:MOSC N-terminal beta barrel domain